MAWRYLVDELPGDLAPGALVELAGEEAHHAAVVARAAPGERLSLGDGRGLVAEGRVEAAERVRVAVRVERVRREEEPSPAIVLAQALAKGDRDELAIQAATELGAAGVVPWQAARSVSRWDARKAPKRLERWRHIVREAAKQSLRAHVPGVGEPVSTQELAALAAADGVLALVLDPGGDVPLASAAARIRDDAPARVLLVVGPEGGIESAELDALAAAGALRVRLGAPVLRTSTAGPAALAALSALLGRW